MGSALTIAIEAVGRRQIALWLLLAWQQNETDPSSTSSLFFHLYASTKS